MLLIGAPLRTLLSLHLNERLQKVSLQLSSQQKDALKSILSGKDTSHVGHSSSVYIMMNPVVLAHFCAFPWLCM